MNSNELEAGRISTVAAGPDGTQYRVVTAMKGVPLRTGPGGGLLSIVLEALVEVFIGAQKAERKVAVFKVNKWGYEPRYLKTRAPSLVAAKALVNEIVEEIERGQLRWI